jgi:thioredoxin-like negative regulator of GroEL
MLKVYESVKTHYPAFPMAVVDEMKMPAVANTLGVTTIPSWVLFGADGAPASIITGFEDPDDVKAALRSWLEAGR